MNICPAAAISMEADEKGFLYPSVDKNKCTDCGLCSQVCAFQKGGLFQNLRHEIYAVKHRNLSIRLSSSSGGMFSALCQYVIRFGGTVYGAAFDSSFSVVHTRADTLEACEAFRGAKYVQSRLGQTFRQVRQDLLDGRMVLFSGTPCQVDSLKSYLKNVRGGTLITCDVVCHGVPSPLIWHEYLNFMGENPGISHISFRDKCRGWHHSEIRIDREDGTCLSMSHGRNPFSYLYFSHYILRTCCGSCPYACMQRAGDISIGDFWGMEQTMADFDDDQGVTLTFINSQLGRKIFDAIRPELIVREVSESECSQPNLSHPSSLRRDEENFWRDYRCRGFQYVVNRYTPCGKASAGIEVRRFISRLIHKFQKYLTEH